MFSLADNVSYRHVWTPMTVYRKRENRSTATLAIGAPSYRPRQASARAAAKGVASDVFIVNGFPVEATFFDRLAKKYDRVITIEDGAPYGMTADALTPRLTD